MSSDKIKLDSIKVSPDLVWHNSVVTRSNREDLNGHKGLIVWFTGLSGAGKSTLAHAVEDVLHRQGCRTFVLDGDNVRHGLCSDLGFSEADRMENIRRIGEVAKLFMQAGIIVLTAFISPFRQDRTCVRNMVANGEFIEIFCNTPLAICEKRDVKGLYKKARLGLIQEFTGVSSPYEAPEFPELQIDTSIIQLEESVNMIMEYLISNQKLDKTKATTSSIMDRSNFELKNN